MFYNRFILWPKAVLKKIAYKSTFTGENVILLLPAIPQLYFIYITK